MDKIAMEFQLAWYPGNECTSVRFLGYPFYDEDRKIIISPTHSFDSASSVEDALRIKLQRLQQGAVVVK